MLVVTQVLCQFALLAQAAAPGAPAEDPNWMLRTFLPLAVIMMMFYFMFIRPKQREQQEMQSMVQNLKENDRVVTIGGIHGVVTNVQRDAGRLTIRVDESTGAKLKVNMSAVARVLKGDEADTAASGPNKS